LDKDENQLKMFHRLHNFVVQNSQDPCILNLLNQLRKYDA